MVKIVIADPCPIVREGLKHIIQNESDLTVAGEAGTTTEGIALLGQYQADVLIMDIFLPNGDGFEFFHKVHRQYPHLPILIWSYYSEDHFALRTLKMGARAYLEKTASTTDILRVIRKVATGTVFISPKMAEKWAILIQDTTQLLPHEQLTDREFQIFMMLITGKSVKEISKALFLSYKTVSAHRRNILEKLHSNTDAQLILYAIHHGLIPLM